MQAGNCNCCWGLIDVYQSDVLGENRMIRGARNYKKAWLNMNYFSGSFAPIYIYIIVQRFVLKD